MRSIVRRTTAVLGGLVCLTALAPAAFAEPGLHLAPKTASHVRTVRVVDVEARARAALARVSPFAAAQRAALQATTTDRFGDGETIVRFEQTHHGLPVIGRGAAVRLSASGDEILTTIDLEEDLPSIVAALAPAAAASIGARVAPGTITADDAHLVVWPLRGGGSRLAYAILPRIPAGLPTAPRVIVDAQTGKVIEARDLVLYSKANVYEFNPTKTAEVGMRDLALTPSSSDGKLTNPFITSANCIDNKTTRPLNVQGFKATVHVCDVEQLATANASGDYVYAPTDSAGAMSARSDEFSEVSMYYHTAKAYDFFRTLQGDPEAQVVVDKPLRVVANLQIPAGIASGNLLLAGDPNTPLETFSNAFFSPAGGGLGAIFQQLYGLKGGGLWFGQGPQRDYAYDGDVVYHELTHAVVDATLKLEAWHVDARGAIDSPGAMNEGLADYFSSAITGDPDVGEYASKDLSQSSGVIRTLANNDACPAMVIGEVHFDSTLFSGALWQARTALVPADRGKFDAALYKAMRTNAGRGDLGYDDLAKLFAATLGTDFPAGAAALDKAMTARGILPSCERILELKSGAAIRSVEPALGGFAAPGIQSIAGAEIAPGIFQVHVKVGPADGKLVVSFKGKASSGGGNPLGGQGTPFTPVALAKFGKAITWTSARGMVSHDADKVVDMEAGTRTSATFDVPAGTTDVFLQIGNKGEADGTLDDVTVALEAKTAGVDPPVTTEPPAAEPAQTPAAIGESDNGCGCSTPGRSPTAPLTGLLAGIALAAAVVRRRRA